MSRLHNRAENWSNLFKPYRGKFTLSYTVKDGLFEFEKFITKEERLSFELISKALNGKSKTKVGFFNRYNTKVIGIDIDNHYSEAWNSETPSKELFDKYEKVIQKIGLPSLLFKSPGGLHLFYFLDYSVFHEVMEYKLKKILEELKEKEIEILPTPNHSLKIDPVKNLIDTKTFKPIPYPEIEKVTFYYPEDLVKENCLPSEYREQRVKRGKSFFKKSNLDKLEENLLPIKAGETNEKYKTLSALYFTNGLSQREAEDRFLNLLFVSGYVGEMRDPREIKRRFTSTCKNLKKNGFQFEGLKKDRQPSLLDLQLIETVSSDFKSSIQRKNALRKYMTEIFTWSNYHEEMSKSEFEFWSWFYSEYRYNRKNNLIPIPWVIMRAWNNRPRPLNDYLKERGILTPMTDYEFDLKGEKAGRCRYYKINRLYRVSNEPKDIDFIEELKESKLSLSEIGRILGVDKSTVCLWYSGKRNIPFESLVKYQSLWCVDRSAHNKNTMISN